MRQRIVSILLGVAVVFSSLLLFSRAAAWRLPGNQEGYEPPQPIAFSHRLHAGELQVDCLYCHGDAQRSRHAGIPAANICMNCHRLVTAPWGVVLQEEELAAKENRKPRTVVSPELGKLYDALGLGDGLQPDPAKAPQPIAWNRIYRLPDFVYFDHRPHVGAGVACQQCHGPVETMERVRQVGDLSMGWCVNCHRETARTGVAGKPVNPSVDCATCHF